MSQKKADVVAIIPARGGSKGIPKKNIIDFCGKPLIAWTIEQALTSSLVDDVYVSTDDEEIKKISTDRGAKIVSRPPEIATDTSTSEEALMHAISQIEKHRHVEIVVFLQATSPLREPHDIDEAIVLFLREKADSLFSASVLNDPCIWSIMDHELRSLTYDYKNRGRRQERSPYFLENGSIYIFRSEVLRTFNNRLGAKIVIYPMPFWKSFEIDTLEDLEICSYLMRKKILGEVEQWIK